MAYPGYGAPPPGYGPPATGVASPPGAVPYGAGAAGGGAGYGAPPPPAGYGAPPAGYGAPPPGYGAAPPGYGAPPGYPGSPAGAPPAYGVAAPNPTCLMLFQSVDTDRSGSINFKELHRALTAGGWSAFSTRTTKLLIRMFSPSHTSAVGSLSYADFERLWSQLGAWRTYFDAADRDRSGKLDQAEVAAAVRQFGFNVPPPVLAMMFAAYDEDNTGSVSFDEYLQLLAELNSLTAMFRRHDSAGSGTATMDYAGFLSIVYATRC